MEDWLLPPSLNQPVPRRVGPSLLVKAITAILALVMAACLSAIVNPKLGIMLGIFGDPVGNPGAAVLAAAITLMLLLYQVNLYRQQKNLMSQGTAAPATYTGYYEYFRGKQRFARTTYAFKDGRGDLVQGEKSTLLVQSDTRPELVKLADLNSEKPFVLFDPRNSAKHMIYPGTLTEFR
jgi:hypothetical protein